MTKHTPVNQLRDDLRLSGWALSHGFSVHARSNTERSKIVSTNYVYDENVPVPHHSLKFVMCDYHIWSTSTGWRYARLVNGSYCEHSTVEEDLLVLLNYVRNIFLE